MILSREAKDLFLCSRAEAKIRQPKVAFPPCLRASVVDVWLPMSAITCDLGDSSHTPVAQRPPPCESGTGS